MTIVHCLHPAQERVYAELFLSDFEAGRVTRRGVIVHKRCGGTLGHLYDTPGVGRAANLLVALRWPVDDETVWSGFLHPARQGYISRWAFLGHPSSAALPGSFTLYCTRCQTDVAVVAYVLRRHNDGPCRV